MSYPNITDKDFNKKITNKYAKYKIPKKKKSFNEICFPKQFNLQMPQKFVSQYINPKTPYKDLLIFHKIGSGKTCSAISIAEKWKGLRKIYIVLPASLKGNFRGELRSKCAQNSYLNDEEREKLAILHPQDEEYQKIIFKSDQRIDKYYTIYSYNKFIDLAENGKLNFQDSILIIDEIQNMVSEKGKYYEVLYKAIHSAPSDLRIVLLSATPIFDKPIEIALTLNLLRLPMEFPTGPEFNDLYIDVKKQKNKYVYNAKNLDMFKKNIHGFISYYRGAPPYTFPNTTIRFVKCKMNDFQNKSYFTVLEKERQKKKNMSMLRIFKEGQILDLSNSFFIGTRLISNIAFPNKNINEEGLLSFTGKYLELENLQDYSIKFYKIINKINRSKGKVFFYSSFRNYGGIESFTRVLDAQGYKNYSQFGEGRKRYAIFSGEENQNYKEEIKTIFNKIDNLDGSKLKILLGSMATAVGLSLYGVQQAHILEPTWNISKLRQILGRVDRFCSHKDLPPEKRNAKIYIYLATNDDKIETVDQYIINLALQKNNLVNQFELALKESAIDCELNRYGNEYEGETPIKCDI